MTESLLSCSGREAGAISKDIADDGGEFNLELCIRLCTSGRLGAVSLLLDLLLLSAAGLVRLVVASKTHSTLYSTTYSGVCNASGERQTVAWVESSCTSLSI
jgi:hypothetical protein